MKMLRGNSGRDTDRLEAFTDAIIAIAITLLVLDIKVPSSEANESNQALWHALGDIWPSYFGYALSFIVLGIMWVNHHQIFQYIARTNHTFLIINVFFLLCVSFLPFPTGLVAEYIGHEGEGTATIVYTGWFLMTAIFYNLIWRYPQRAGLIDEAADPAAIAAINRVFSLGPPSYLIAFLVAFISPTAALIIMTILAILYAIPSGWLLLRKSA
jgi:uncharacterized membrane protein